MKTYNKYAWMASLKALHECCTTKEFAKAFVDAVNKDHKDALELKDTKSDGFIVRKKTDATLGDGYLYETVADVTADILGKNSDEVSDFISDNFDIKFDKSKINNEFAKEMFDISRNGRLIYIEEDT